MNIPMIVFGDSIMWGQGLNDANKFSTLVSNRLATYLSAQGISVDLHVFAHSGATVWPIALMPMPHCGARCLSRRPSGHRWESVRSDSTATLSGLGRWGDQR